MFFYDVASRLACSTLLYRSFSLGEALEAIAGLEIGYVDLWAAAGQLEHVDPAESDAGAVRALIEGAGLRVSSLSAYGLSGDEMVARLGFAGALGARTVIGEAPSLDQERREAADDTRALGRAAQEAGVTLCLSNRGGTWVGRPEDTSGFLDDVGHPRVQLSLSPPHAQAAGVPLRRLVEAVGGRVGHAYLWSAAQSASEETFGDADEQIPGNGAVDFDRMTALLEEHGYNGMFTLAWQGAENWELDRVSEAVRRARAHVLEVTRAG